LPEADWLKANKLSNIFQYIATKTITIFKVNKKDHHLETTQLCAHVNWKVFFHGVG